MKRITTTTILAAFLAALFAASAAAALHWQRNGIPLEGRTYWAGVGTVKLQSVTTTFSDVCRTAEGGYDENPAGGGAGVGAVEMAVSYDCTVSSCPGYAQFAAEQMPWPLSLEESGGIKVRVGEVMLRIECWPNRSELEKAVAGLGGSLLSGSQYGGVLHPSLGSGTSAEHPAYEEYSLESGLLSEVGGTNKAELLGKIKVIGYKEAELIGVS